MQKVSSIIINDKLKTKTQLQVSYCVIVLFAGLVTLGVSYILRNSLSGSIHKYAEKSITKQTVESVAAVSVETSNSALQHAKIFSENFVMNSVLYQSVLINYANITSVNGPLFAPMTSFYDFNFILGCIYPNCPSDIQNNPNSITPPSVAFSSLNNSSVYLYSGKYQQAVRNDSFWNQVVAESPEIMNVVDGLVFLDFDDQVNHKICLNQGLSCSFYHTAKVENLLTGHTNVIHRSFPGSLQNETILYDPSLNEWFTNAPVNAVYLSSPQIQPDTQQAVISISSRKVVYYPAGTQDQRITFVTASLNSLESLAATIDAVTYDASGFGAVMNCETNEVLVWNDQTYSVFHNKTILRDYDATLATIIDSWTYAERQSKQNIQYKDANKTEWVVSYVPYFSSQRYGSDVTYNALTLLTFARLDEANAPLIHLDNSVTHDLNVAARNSLFIVIATAGLVLILAFGTIQFITSPLPKLIIVANEIIAMSTVSEENKDFGAILSDPLFSIRRQDEIGLLITDYYQLLVVLQERSEQNRDVSQYPENVFHIPREDDSSTPTPSTRSTRSHNSGDFSSQNVPSETLTWDWFVSKMAQKMNEDQRVNFAECTEKRQSSKAPVKSLHMPSISELDERSNKVKTVKPSPKSNSILPSLQYRVAVTGRTEFEAVLETDSVDSSESDRKIKSLQDGAVVKFDQTDSRRDSYQIGPEDAQDGDAHDSQRGNSPVLSVGEDKTRSKVPEGSKQSKRSKQSRNAQVTVWYSIRWQLMSLFILLLAGCVLSLLHNISRVNLRGKHWSGSTEINLRRVVVENMQAIADGKAASLEVFFFQVSMDANSNAVSFKKIVSEGSALRPNWFANPDLSLRSYAADVANPYSLGGIATSKNYSGYNGPNLAKCDQTPDNCAAGHSSYNVRVTSIMDMHYRSQFRHGALLYLIQASLEVDGTSRYLPYIRSVNTGTPVTCYIQDKTAPHCAVNFANSSCNANWVNPANPSIKKYPPYDGRCRNFYQGAVRDAARTGNAVNFLTSTSTSGVYLLTVTAALFASDGSVAGVVSSGYQVSVLAESISVLDYLSDGYCYLVRGSDASVMMVHPRATTICSTLQCAEGFSNEEYVTFAQQVLNPLNAQQDSAVAAIYTKNGQEWQLVFSRVVYLNANFILIATLPVEVILETSEEVHRKIGNTVVGMFISFAAVIAFLFIFINLYGREMIKSIVDPINELRDVFELVRMSEDLSGQVPEVASSSDMRVLLDAFSKMMVALRFSNDSYAAGNRLRAQEVYTDALSLYTGNNDKRGIGTSLANLAAAELARQRYDAAENLFKKSIENADEILKDASFTMSRAEENKMERVLSDRKASLASVYCQCERFDAAMEVLTPALEVDVRLGYIIGYALKQCLIGKYHAERGERAAAESVFIDLLKFVRTTKKTTLTSKGGTTTPHTLSPTPGKVRMSKEELESAEQIALYKVALLKSGGNNEQDMAESTFLLSLTKNSVMHTEFTRKGLIELRKMFVAGNRKKHVQQLQWLATEFNLNIVSKSLGSGEFVTSINSDLQPPKRVLICLDTSAHMNGVMFQSTMDNINIVFEHHVRSADSLGILHFNKRLDFALPLMFKAKNELQILNCIEHMQCVSSRKSAMNDALMVSLYTLSLAPTEHDWLILVTSSVDSASRLSLEKTVDKLMFAKVGLIVIGIGDGVQTAALELLASSTKRGLYFHANADRKSINEAFEHAIKIIEMSCGEREEE